MQTLFRLEEFAELAKRELAEIDEMRRLSLLDLNEDGFFDEFDALRLWYVDQFRDQGYSLEEIRDKLSDGSLQAPFVGRYLFRTRDAIFGLEETAEKVELSADQIEELRVAVGFAGPALFDEEDLESFRACKAALEVGLPWGAILEATRVFGDAFRRIAQTEVRMLHQNIRQPLIEAGMSEEQADVQLHTVMSGLQPIMAPLMDFFHRMHIAKEAASGALSQMQGRGPLVSTGRLELAIAFVDLTSFTTLAQVHGDETAAEVLDRLDTLVRSLVLDHGGYLVKQIGDAFMLAFEEPADAVRFAVELGDKAQSEGEFLVIRTGVHYGSVLYRTGDYVGNTVNIASRLATEAMPNEVLMTEPVAEAASKGGIETAPAGVRMLRGSAEPLSLYRVVRTAASGTSRDPVCGRMVGSDAAARLTKEGVEVLFHSEDCLREFLEKPERYEVAPA